MALCLDLWRRLWNDPTAQRHGRSGQADQGVDIYGRCGGSSEWEGVQCRLKGPGRRLGKREIEAAAEKAKEFPQKLSRLIVATTAPRDTATQDLARRLTEDWVRNGWFPITVFAWDDIVDELNKHQDLIREYFPSLAILARGRSLSDSELAALEDAAEDYRRHLLESCNRVTPLLERRPPLEQVYVGLELLRGPWEEVYPPSPQQGADPEGKVRSRGGDGKSTDKTIADQRDRARQARRRQEREKLLITAEDALKLGRVVVLGDPGSGKSTLLRHLAFTLARDQLATCFPVLVTLADFAQSDHCRQGRLKEYLKETLPDSPPLLRLLFGQMLEEGRCCILLDALDEVVGRSDWHKVAMQVDRLAHDLKGNILVISSRKVGFLPNSLPNFHIVEIKDLNLEQIEKMASNWLGGDAALLEPLTSAIRINNRLLALAANPLLLTFLIMVYERQGGKLPQVRAELYGRIVLDLLTWDEEKGRARISPEVKRDILACLAFDAHYEEEKREIQSRDEWVALLAQGPIGERDKGSVFDALAASGLLVQVSRDNWRFLHLSIQEYLAAYARDRDLRSLRCSEITSPIAFALERYRSPWWREVVLHMAGLLGQHDGQLANELISAIASPGQTDLFLSNVMFAAECLVNTSRSSVDALRLRVIQRLTAEYWRTELEELRDTIRSFLATRAIGVADEEVEQDIRQAFLFQNRGVIEKTVQVLSALGYSQGMQRLLELAKAGGDLERLVRAYAVHVLGRARLTEEVIDVLVGRCHTDPEFYVRLYAARALSRFAVASIPAREALQQALEDPSPVIMGEAARGLASCDRDANKEPIVSTLVRRAGDSHWYVRLEAVRALGLFSEQREARSLLSERAQDSNRLVRGAAIAALTGDSATKTSLGPRSGESRAASPLSVELLVRTALRGHGTIAGEAVRALGSLQPGDAVEYLKAFLLLAETRERAIEALARIDTPESVAALIPWLLANSLDGHWHWHHYSWPGSDIRRPVLVALAGLKEAHDVFQDILAGRPPKAEPLADYLRADVIAVLAAFVRDHSEDERCREDVIEALSVLRSPSTLPLLEGAVEDGELLSHSAEKISEGLALIADRVQPEPLVALCERMLFPKVSGEACVHIATALAATGGPAALDLLRRRLMDHPDPRVRIVVAQQMDLFERDGGQEMLAKLGRDEVPEVRQAAIATYLVWLAGKYGSVNEPPMPVRAGLFASALAFEEEAGGAPRLNRALDEICRLALGIQPAEAPLLADVLRMLARSVPWEVRPRVIALLCVFDPPAAAESLRRVVVGDWLREHLARRFARWARIAKSPWQWVKRARGQTEWWDDLELFDSSDSDDTRNRDRVIDALGRLPESCLESLRVSPFGILRRVARDASRSIHAPLDGEIPEFAEPVDGPELLSDALFGTLGKRVEGRAYSGFYDFEEESGPEEDDAELRSLALEVLTTKGDRSAAAQLVEAARKSIRGTPFGPFWQSLERTFVSPDNDTLVSELCDPKNKDLILPTIEAVEMGSIEKIHEFRGWFGRRDDADARSRAVALANAACDGLGQLGACGDDVVRARVDEAVERIRGECDSETDDLTLPSIAFHETRETEERILIPRIRRLRADWDFLEEQARVNELKEILSSCAEVCSLQGLRRAVPWRIEIHKGLDGKQVSFEPDAAARADVSRVLEDLEGMAKESFRRKLRQQLRTLSWRLNHPFSPDERQEAFRKLWDLGRRGEVFFLNQLGIGYRLMGIARVMLARVHFVRRVGVAGAMSILRGARAMSIGLSRAVAEVTHLILGSFNLRIARGILVGMPYRTRREYGFLNQQSLRTRRRAVLDAVAVGVCNAIRTATIHWVSNFRAAEAELILSELADSTEGLDVAHAAVALSRRGHPRAIKCLEEVAYRHHRVTAFLRTAKRYPNPELVPNMITEGIIRHFLPRLASFDVFKRMGDPGRKELVRLLLDPTFDDRCESDEYLPREVVAEGLGHVGGDSAKAALAQIIAAQNEPIRLKEACGRAMMMLRSQG